MRRLVLLVLVLLGTCLLTAPPASAVDMDCGDFATQAEAQAFFLASGPGDPHLLDGDGDGVACETNPCPCSGTVVPFVGTATPTPTPTATPTTTPTTTPTDPNGSGESGPTRRDRARVVRVTDGDTLKVRLADGSEEYVRLIGIDTPEVHGRSECGGPEASRSMDRLAPVGSRVLLVSDPSQADRDRYDRLLRYVERRGRDVGKAQIATGHAQVYVYRDDPFRRTDAYRRAEARSERQGRGSWSRCWR
jgi:endonuclease YncB( thermonuclease family)